MRIIAGKHRGRTIAMKEGKDIRPTSSMARESIFNILMHGQFSGEDSPLIDCHVVDLFCGTGALGFEALSRGAKKVTFIDQNQDSLNLVRTTASAFGEMAHCRFVRSDSTSLPLAYDPCSLAFLDPPYNSGLAPIALQSLKKQEWLSPKAVCVVEVSSKEPWPVVEGFEVVMERLYGNAKIVLLRIL